MRTPSLNRVLMTLALIALAVLLTYGVMHWQEGQRHERVYTSLEAQGLGCLLLFNYGWWNDWPLVSQFDFSGRVHQLGMSTLDSAFQWEPMSTDDLELILRHADEDLDDVHKIVLRGSNVTDEVIATLVNTIDFHTLELDTTAVTSTGILHLTKMDAFDTLLLLSPNEMGRPMADEHVRLNGRFIYEVSAYEIPALFH